MKTIGLIGGLSWQSTSEYYRIINEEVNKRAGKNHSASIVMYSFNFQTIEELQKQGDWTELGIRMSHAAGILANSGTDLLLICSNTMHRCAESIKKQTSVPLIHIIDSVGRHLVSGHIQRAGFLGTKYLMDSPLYPAMLKKKYGVEVFRPSKNEIETVNEIIYEELVKGIVRDPSRKIIQKIIGNMISKNISAIILGCTEIPLLIKQKDINIPVIDTTYIHAIDAVNQAFIS